LGTNEFYNNEQVKKEFKLRNNLPPVNWDESIVHLLEQHKYFTSYGRRYLVLVSKRILNLLAKN
jgi:hypothetical protein